MSAPAGPARADTFVEGVKGDIYAWLNKTDVERDDEPKNQAASEVQQKYGNATVVPMVELQRMHKLPGIIVPATLDFKTQRQQPRKIFLQPTAADRLSSVDNPNNNAKAVNLSMPSYDKPFGAQQGDSGLPPTDNPEIDFMQVVDEDETQAYNDYIAENLVGRLVDSSIFRAVIVIVILMNTILVGLQTSGTMQKRYAAQMHVFDKVFLTIFALEIALKWYHGFWSFWRVRWNVFDFILVAISLVGDGFSFLRTGQVLRILRVLRAFRSLRSISALKELQMVVQTILRSLPDMANILVLLLIVNFIFSVVGVDMFGKDAPEYFGSIGQALYTLFILMSQDGWVQIYDVLKSRGLALQAALFFTVYIIIGALVFANIIVGVTVTNLQFAYKEMKDVRQQKHRTLANTDDHGGDRGKGGDTLVPTLKTDKIAETVWVNQTPLEVPDFRNFTLQAVENYYLTLIAIEDNLAEHQKLKSRLRQVLSRVRRYNVTSQDNESDEEELEGGDDDDLDGQDALTRAMKLEEQKEAKRLKRRESLTMAKRRDMQKRLNMGEPSDSAGAAASPVVSALDRALTRMFKKESAHTAPSAEAGGVEMVDMADSENKLGSIPEAAEDGPSRPRAPLRRQMTESPRRQTLPVERSLFQPLPSPRSEEGSVADEQDDSWSESYSGSASVDEWSSDDQPSPSPSPTAAQAQKQ